MGVNQINRYLIMSFAFGIVSIMLFVICYVFHYFIWIYLNLFSILLPAVGLTLGIIGIKLSIFNRKKHKSKLNILGLIINILAVIFQIVMFIGVIQLIRMSMW